MWSAGGKSREPASSSHPAGGSIEIGRCDPAGDRSTSGCRDIDRDAFGPEPAQPAAATTSG
jgi:hypothetical protein